MSELPKGIQMMLTKMLGISPEMLKDPKLLLAGLGINIDEIVGMVAKFEQIGLSINKNLAEINLRLARLEAHAGIPYDGNGVSDGRSDREPANEANGKLPGLGQRTPDRRN